MIDQESTYMTNDFPERSCISYAMVLLSRFYTVLYLCTSFLFVRMKPSYMRNRLPTIVIGL